MSQLYCSKCGKVNESLYTNGAKCKCKNPNFIYQSYTEFLKDRPVKVTLNVKRRDLPKLQEFMKGL